jgi:hypothetical protein
MDFYPNLVDIIKMAITTSNFLLYNSTSDNNI